MEPLRRIFRFEKETTNTLRYREQPGRGEAVAIGAIYVRKDIADGAQELEVLVKQSDHK